MRQRLILCSFLSFFTFAHGQAINYWTSQADTFRIRNWLLYENDFFTATDQNYTQGIALYYQRMVRPQSRLTPLFFHLPNAYHTIGMGIDHQAFTPADITSDSLLVGDRPYAATFRGNAIFSSRDTVRHRILAWSLSLGIIGPEAGGKQLQTNIHRATDNYLPLGWGYQINTGLLADLGIRYEQRIVGIRRWLLFTAQGTGNIGTSRIDATLGASLQLKLIKKRLALAVYATPAVRFVGYDGTLQGSLIGQRNVYTVPDAQINRIVAEQEGGVWLTFRRMGLQWFYRYQSQVFGTVPNHRWGGFRLVYQL